MLHIIILKGFIFFIQKMGQNWLICPQSREVSLEVGLWLVWQQQAGGASTDIIMMWMMEPEASSSFLVCRFFLDFSSICPLSIQLLDIGDKRKMFFASFFCLLCVVGVRASEPIEPDMSEACLSCQSQVSQLMETWTNETTVAAILEDLEKNCKTEYNFMEAKICDALVQVFVQIPPGLFEGIETLAWPMPLAPCALVAECHVNCCAAGAPPEQVHLSVAGTDSSQMGVAWTTLDAPTSVVQYGTSPDSLDMTATGNVDTYTFAGWIGMLHTATMTDLKASTTYYYRVGDGVSSWSEVK